MQIRRVSAIKISQIVCMFMKQEIFYAGVNQMKDKTRIALMVGASDSGGGGATFCGWETEKYIMLQTDERRKAYPSI